MQKSGRSGVRTPAEVRKVPLLPSDQPWVPSPEGRGCGSGWSMKLTIHSDLEPRLSESGGVPLLLLYAFTSRKVTNNTDRQCLIPVHTAVVRNNKLKLLIPFRASVTASPLVKHLGHYLKHIIIVPSSSLKLIHHLSHTKARCLTDIPMRSGTRRRHLPAVPSHL